MFVPAISALFLAGRHIPEARGLVRADTGKLFAVFTEGNPVHVARMPLQLANLQAAERVQDSNRTIGGNVSK